VLVEQEPSREMRRRLEERKPVPDELESKDAEGGAALGDPTSMRSWLSCLDICGRKFLNYVLEGFSFFLLSLQFVDHIFQGPAWVMIICKPVSVSCVCARS
jgi:hypothetical protein